MSTSDPSASFLHLTDEAFLSKLAQYSKPKDRSHTTHHNVHLPELNHRLSLSLDLPTPASSSEADDPFAAKPDLENKEKIEVIYLGNSMLERLKNTGLSTNLARDRRAWNAGVGGDTNANVLYRLSLGLYSLLRDAQAQNENMDIKLWILASGTNDLHKKRGLREKEVEADRLLVGACLRIAPRSRVLACDMFYRKDIPNGVVDESNAKLENVVKETNEEVRGGDEEEEEDRVLWVESRGLIGEERLVDHVHLDEEGYRIWDGVLWPRVCKVLGRDPLGSEEQKRNVVM